MEVNSTPEVTPSADQKTTETKKQIEQELHPVAAQLSPYRKLFTSEVVTVEVGPSKVPFVFHKGLICSRSAFFEAAFNGSSKEAATQTMHLEDDDPDDFDIVHKWFYTDDITVAVNGTDQRPPFHDLLQAYSLADKLDIPQPCDTATDNISDTLNQVQMVHTRNILAIYQRTAPNDRLRKLVIELILPNHLYNLDEVTIRYPEAFASCPELLMDFFVAVKERCVSSPYKTHPIALYSFHRHGQNDPCRHRGQQYNHSQFLLDGRPAAQR
ncbi:MAG: hypothetical protein Q9168_006331 [Polycauliona sp. 1 TL-2023]